MDIKSPLDVASDGNHYKYVIVDNFLKYIVPVLTPEETFITL